jgi:predicted peroxiredoxin
VEAAPETKERRRLVVTISHGVNGDRSTVGLTIANAALSAGMEVLVFMVSDGVELVRDGAAEMAYFPPFRPLGALIDAFTESGGNFVACGSCCQYRGMKPQGNAEGALVAGVATLISWLESGATVISL